MSKCMKCELDAQEGSEFCSAECEAVWKKMQAHPENYPWVSFVEQPEKAKGEKAKG